MQEARPGAGAAAADRPGTLLAEATRAGSSAEFVESRHVGHLVVAISGSGGSFRHLLPEGSDLERPVVCRSAIKSLQALPLVERGLADQLELTDAELALLVASHEGTPRHVAAVRALLERTGLREEDLACGPHAPFDAETRRAMLVSGEAPARAHNNCSGKHTGFLLLTRALGRPLAESVEPDGATQRLVRDVVAEFVGLPTQSIGVATDGCGAPTLYLPLAGLARAFARLMAFARSAAEEEANRDDPVAVRARACARILRSFSAEPFYLAGDRRLCTALVRAFPGRVWPKNGAEGVYVCGVARPDGTSAGVAVKVEDGATRGYEAVVVRVVCALLGEALPPTLASFVDRPVGNTRGDTVGRVRSASALEGFFEALSGARLRRTRTAAEDG